MKKTILGLLLITCVLTPWMSSSFHACSMTEISHSEHAQEEPTVTSHCDFCDHMAAMFLAQSYDVAFKQYSIQQSLLTFSPQLVSQETLFARSARAPPTLL